ncbi:hypothetical protein ACTNDP_14170 [Paenibacillus barengoltzii]|uniref:hypothetical protein n=1 Tax=Paenibacillus TaxID=44249 RepID=UPI00048D1D8E|nr:MULTISPECIES: hypothetical protein [Paenibacillus]MEC0139127.1 hypothetical protein [Paenibacillus macerans]OMG46523.1 hypothetical protein BK140_26470 [Paenibacillus macerans]SMF27712.1 Phosphoribosyl-ATP pyrophosphohydrolase [Paenibacillus barengoltzii]GBK64701.1 hypothetical protein PbDSM24746_47050 [Paenibacillus macerans]GBK70865.1 hypothetical protein PbJCM17693_45730 [Paenibacillus macerans]
MNDLLEAVRELHERHNFKNNGGEDALFRMNLIMEEVGEICSCLTKHKGNLAEEHADLLILLLGNCVAFNIDIETEFWKKMDKLKSYSTIAANGHTRITSKGE